MIPAWNAPMSGPVGPVDRAFMAAMEKGRHPLVTCECGGTWWETHRQIQVFGGDTNVGYRTTAPDCEPSAYAVRSVLTCVACGTVAPHPQRAHPHVLTKP